MDDEPLWKIIKMPHKPDYNGPWKAGMFRKDGVTIGVSFDGRLPFDEAALILQQFAGVLTPAGLEASMTPLPPL